MCVRKTEREKRARNRERHGQRERVKINGDTQKETEREREREKERERERERESWVNMPTPCIITFGTLLPNNKLQIPCAEFLCYATDTLRDIRTKNSSLGRQPVLNTSVHYFSFPSHHKVINQIAHFILFSIWGYWLVAVLALVTSLGLIWVL